MKRRGERTIDIPGLEISAICWGPEDGRPTLGLHGWLDNAATFDRLAPELSDLNLVSIDFPGHGRSEHLRRGAFYHFFDLVPTIFDVMNALEWDECSLLGHSMGAAAASLAAGTRPDRIDRMVWIDGLGPWTTPPDEAPGQLREGLEQRETLLTKDNRVFDSEEHAVRIIADMYGIADEAASPLVERGLREVEGGVSFTYDLALRGESMLRLTEEQLKAFMTDITAPTRVIRATNGWPVDDEIVRRRLGWIDECDVDRLEGGHHVHLSDPGAVAELVGSWFSNG